MILGGVHVAMYGEWWWRSQLIRLHVPTMFEHACGLTASIL